MELGKKIRQLRYKAGLTQEQLADKLGIAVPDGYTLTGAYNGEGEKIALEKDADGNYYVVVPRGGGVYLSVELEKDEDHDLRGSGGARALADGFLQSRGSGSG